VPLKTKQQLHILLLQETLPCAEYYKRQGFPLKKIVQFAAARDYTDVMVFNEDRKEVNGLLLVHLPDGPTAHFRLSNLKLGRDIKVRASRGGDADGGMALGE
jgi:ribosome production factor 1